MRTILAFILLLVAGSGSAQENIVFVDAPPLQRNPADSFSYGVSIEEYGDNTVQYPIDVDGDGTADFTLISLRQALRIIPNGQNAVLSEPSGSFGSTWAVRLDAGQTVGRLGPAGTVWQQRIDSPFGVTLPVLSYFANIGVFGEFAQRFGFVGLRFMVGNEVHYGFLQLDCLGYYGDGGFLEAYGWNTVPDAPIRAGQKPGRLFLHASFSGSEEVPANDSPHSGQGMFALDGNELTYWLDLDTAFRPLYLDLDYPLSVKKATRMSGISIFGPAAPGSISHHVVAHLFSYRGLPVSLQPHEVVELLRGNFYISLASSEFPRGEVRGQILLSR